MKKIIVAALIFAFLSCADKDSRRREADPRFAGKECLNDSVDVEMFDESGKIYYEYGPCPDHSSAPKDQDSSRPPCENDSMETERFDEQGNVYYIKVPCPD